MKVGNLITHVQAFIPSQNFEGLAKYILWSVIKYSKYAVISIPPTNDFLASGYHISKANKSWHANENCKNKALTSVCKKYISF